MQNEDIGSKTGEGIYRRAILSLDRIDFQGKEGTFYQTDKDAKKDEIDGKYPKKRLTNAGEPLEVVFLKIRRKLGYFSKRMVMNTSEHNHKGEKVVLYKTDGKEVGIAKDLRKKYPMLKTQQIVYCWVPKLDTIARLTIKGASLGSEYKHKTEVFKFYDYLQSFSRDEHSHQFITKLCPVVEEGPMDDYYAISFVKGEKLSAVDLENVKGMIENIHEKITEIDGRLDTSGTNLKPGKDEIPVIEEGEQYEQFNKKNQPEDTKVDKKDIAGWKENMTDKKDIPVVEDNIDVKEIPF